MLLVLLILAIFLTTLRHEMAHAAASWAQGIPVHEMRLLPGYDEELGFYFGYVARGDGGSWLIDAAPFFAAILWFAGFAWLYRRISRRSEKRLWVFVIGLVSPMVDIAYGYVNGLTRPGSDVADLLAVLPAAGVHAAFALVLFTLFVHTRRMGPVLSRDVSRDRR